MSEQTGVPNSSPPVWSARQARYRIQDDFTARLAGILEAADVPVFRIGPGFATIGLVTGRYTPARRQYRRIHFLPAVAATLRAELANALELYISTRAPHARYGVVTTGDRCCISEVRERIIRLSRRISRWHLEICRPLGIDVIFRGIEITIDAASTCHVHANVIYQPGRFLHSRIWERFLVRTRAFFGAHWQDNGRLQDVREVVKYIIKGDDLKRLADRAPDEIPQLYHQLKHLHLVQPLGGFRGFRSRLAQNHLKVVPIKQSGRRRLILTKRPSRDLADQQRPAAFKTNHLYSIDLPSAAFCHLKEPVVRVGNLDIQTLWNDQHLRYRAGQALADWYRNGGPPPHQIAPDGHRPFTVHTCTLSAGTLHLPEAPRVPGTAAGDPHAPRAPP